MKTLIIVLACALFGAALYGSAGQAQAPGPDVGETDLLVLGCNYATLLAEGEGYTVRNCRRGDPDEVEGNRAIITVRLQTKEIGGIIIFLHFQRSLWTVSNFQAARD